MTERANVEMEQEAAKFAAISHANQLRKYTFEPYVVHCTEVVRILKGINATSEMIVAGYLHDTIEDCGKTKEEIEEKFGATVAHYVDMLTHFTTKEMGNRATRMKMEKDRLALACNEVKTIKLADSISNTKDIETNCTDGFKFVYMKEKRELLEALKGGDSSLWNELKSIIDKFYEIHGEK